VGRSYQVWGDRIDLHFSEIDNGLGTSRRIRLDHCEGGSDSKGPVQDIDTEDDRVAFTERRDDLQATGPHSLRSSVSSLGFCDLLVVSLERVKQVVDDIS